MTENRMLQLVDRLLASAENLDWEYDPNTDGYYVAFHPSLVEIRSLDRDQRHPYGLFVIDDDGRVIEAVTTNDDIPNQYLDKLAGLYHEAKRVERNVDGTLDNIFNQLPDS